MSFGSHICNQAARIRVNKAVAEFKDPDWGDKVNSGIELSCRLARQHGLAGYAEVDFIPQSVIYEFGYRMRHIECRVKSHLQLYF